MFTLDSKEFIESNIKNIKDYKSFLQFNHKVVVIDHNLSLTAPKINE